MKPIVHDSKCGASEGACKVIKICPVEAISYIKINEPITNRNVECNTSSNCGCSCGCDCDDNSNDCGGSLYGRIVIDYDKCTGCGICVEECCGSAIEMID
ncbi:MAG: 4Fe-4S binding protein [Oscillospiraceae bacterium]|nr:4Fe-4S binding protein [Oscillospiraceae bacterium]